MEWREEEEEGGMYRDGISGMSKSSIVRVRVSMCLLLTRERERKRE